MTEVLAVVSGKGGVGKTTVASNLSFALKSLGKRVLLIDLNITTPHLNYYIGFNNYRYTINDALAEKTNMLSVISNVDGIRFIPAAQSLEKVVKVTPKQVGKLLENYKKFMNFDYIILDSAPGIGREAITAMSVADSILFVANPYLPSISDINKCKSVASELGKEKMSIVLNMYDGFSYELNSETVESLTGIKVIGEIPFDKNVNIALSLGVPVIIYKPNSLASLAILKLASNLIGENFESKKLKFHKLWVKFKDKLFYSFNNGFKEK